MANLRLILKPSVPANPYLGTPGEPALFVQFKDGQSTIVDPALIERMQNHRLLNREFIIVKEHEVDPYASTRAPAEPAHTMSEIKNGRVVGRTKDQAKKALPQAVEKMINDRAKEIAIAMVPEIIKGLAETEEKATEEEDPEETEVKKEESTPKKKKATTKAK